MHVIQETMDQRDLIYAYHALLEATPQLLPQANVHHVFLGRLRLLLAFKHVHPVQMVKRHQILVLLLVRL